MLEKEKTEGMLSPYRVLDLTDEKGLLCGKLLGDLGADVIKVERPGGDPARNIGPFYHDEADPEKSLFWFAFNTSKRGITLNIETTDGQEALKRLVKGSDFLIESFSPGYLDKLGLGYSDLEEINPGIIMVSISPFGQTGPYRDYKAPDIVAWAMGGQMYPWGDADRPPVRISHHSQAYLHTASEAAVGALMALYRRQLTGEGQQVDVSIQEAVAQSNNEVISSWDMVKVIVRRGGLRSDFAATVRRIWPCKDGYVASMYQGGTNGSRYSLPLVEWMKEEGMANDFLTGFDWDTFDLRETTQDIVDRLEEPTARFFLTHTKAELLEGAVNRRVRLYPVATTADILESVQLDARDFWVKVEHPELGTSITYPGAFARASETDIGITRRAPLIGEHNQEILGNESGISGEVESRSDGAQRANKGDTRPKRPLDGIKIADFTWLIAGTRTSKALADYGAEVVKLESSVRPDPSRPLAPFKDGVPGLNRGNANQWNTSKLSIAVNLSSPKGVDVARKLVSWADIVVENFAGGVMKRMGLGYEELKKLKPDIIMLSSCMQGQTGPHAKHPGLGSHLTSLSGFSQIAGWPDREPLFLGVYTDFIVCRFNTLAILAALEYRRRTGKGQYIDASQYESSLHFMSPLILDYTINGRIANRMGNRNEYAAPHGAYRCRGEDRWCAIAVFTDDEWYSFCEVTGNPSWAGDPRFATLAARKENEDELDRLVEGWTVNLAAEEVMDRLQSARVPAGVLQTGEDLLEHDPQLKHRRFFRELDHPEIGTYHAAGPAFRLSKAPSELRSAPLLGQHSEYVLKDLLGMSEEEITGLVIDSVIE